MNPDEIAGMFEVPRYQDIITNSRSTTYNRSDGYVEGGLMKPLTADGQWITTVSPSTHNPSVITNKTNGLTRDFSEALSNTAKALRDMRKSIDEGFGLLYTPKGTRTWSDEGEPGSPYVRVNNTIRKENGVKIRKSVDVNDPVARPKPSKTICREHSEKFSLRREDMSWGCNQCDQGRVPFNRWYKDTYSLGYLKVHGFTGADHEVVPQEVVVTVDESYTPLAVMIQRSDAAGTPVFVTDLGRVTTDLVSRANLDEDGVRTITLSELYGLPNTVPDVDASDDQESED